MEAGNTTLELPGRPDKPTREVLLQKGNQLAVKIRQVQTVDAASRSGGAMEFAKTDLAGDDVVELEFENDVRVMIRGEELIKAARPSGNRESGEQMLRLPHSWPSGEVSRGGVGEIMLKGLKVFGIDLEATVAKEGARKIAEICESEIERTHGFGLYRFDNPVKVEPGSRVREEESAGILRGSEPFLIFIHGTASSSTNCYGKLAGADEWESLQEKYKDRIFALEHKTLSASPIDNAIDLVKLLPTNARLHLVSHSRGGLVGELLCLGQAEGARAKFDELTRAFEAGDAQEVRTTRAEQRKKLSWLWDSLIAKKVKVERFIRIACPARGTTLASDRLDWFASAILTGLGLATGVEGNPIYEMFQATFAALIKEKSNPQDLPGIEAMDPKSPLIHFLNHDELTTEADLGIISGDVTIGNLRRTIPALLANAFFWADNDLVVNTKAMYGGIRRRQEALYFFDQGKDVTHFRYFLNPSTRARLLSWLTQSPAENEKTKGFKLLTRGAAKLELPQSRGGGEQPRVFVLPGIMGSHLRDADDRVWLNYGRLMSGGMKRLEMVNPNVSAEPQGLIADHYQDLVTDLGKRFRVIPFAFDWRQSIRESGGKLREAVRAELAASEQPIHFIAHSMGGLVARSMIALDKELWANVCDRKGRLVMLGTPNHGAYDIVRMLSGRDRLLTLLSLLDAKSNAEDLLRIFRGYPGLLDLLPEEYFDPESWRKLDAAEGRTQRTIDGELLRSARDWRKTLRDSQETDVNKDHMIYVAGSAESTLSAIEIDSQTLCKAVSQGDGRVTYKSGILDNVATKYMDCVHGDMANNRESFAALIELLETGKTDLLSDVPPVYRGLTEVHSLKVEDEEPIFFPDAADLAAAANGGKGKALEPDPQSYILQVSVTHGDLRVAKHPIAVGHYNNDGIIGVEALLDRLLDGSLSKRAAMRMYPGQVGSAEVIHAAPGSAIEGVLVIGLGEMGEITFDSIRLGVSAAALRHALLIAERPGTEKYETWRSAAISSLLIGTYGGNALTVKDSVSAIVLGVMNANRTLQEQGLWDRVRIDHLELIEIYEDIAGRAIRSLHDMKTDPPVDFADTVGIDVSPATVITTSNGGGRYYRPESSDYSAYWWRRIQILGGKREQAKNVRTLFPGMPNTLRLNPEIQDAERKYIEKLLEKSSESPEKRAQLSAYLHHFLGQGGAPHGAGSGLEFLVLTDRARAEGSLQATQRQVVDWLVKEAIGGTEFDEKLSTTLFELLIPNDLKDQVDNVVLLVDREAAQYPWELLTERSQREKPLVTRIGMLRQFKTTDYRPNPQPSRGTNALVIGDPKNPGLGYPELEGARREAERVSQELENAKYNVTPLIQPGAVEVFNQLFAREYQILHIAAHGKFNPDDPDESGIVLEQGRLLSTKELVNLRTVPDLVFINCCHLGEMETDGKGKTRLLSTEYPHRLAASVAEELIRMGVKAVIAAGWAVDDKAAASFASHFYRRMLAGESFGQAVLEARQQTHREHGAKNTWGAYQCYGNPGFRLKQWARKREKSPLYYSRREYREVLKNIAQMPDAELPERNKKLSELLRELRLSIPRPMLDGEMLFEFGEAWRALNSFKDAIGCYREAIHNADGKAAFVSVERLVNLQCRLAEEIKRIGDAHGEIPQWEGQSPEALLEEAKNQLEKLMAIAKTPERYALMGRIYKAQALITADSTRHAGLLTEVKLNYGRAYEEYEKSGNKDSNSPRYYYLINLIGCQLLLGESDDLDDRLKKCESIAAKEGKDGEDFWSKVVRAELTLLRCLQGNNLPEKKEEVLKSYRAAFAFGAKLNEANSVLNQIDFLIAMMRANEAHAQSPGFPALAWVKDELRKVIDASIR